MSSFPIADEANPNEIEWAFVCLPLSNTLPLMPQPKARKEWAELFLALGFRWHPELATKKIRPVGRGMDHSMNGLTRVLDMEEPDPEPINVPDPEEMTAAELAFTLDRLAYMGRVPQAAPEVPAGERMDPTQHEPATVLGYLMAADDTEKRRVIAAEWAGAARAEILDNYKGV